MQHAVALSGEEDDQVARAASFPDAESRITHPTTSEPIKLALSYTWSGIKGLFHLLRPSTIRNGYHQLRQLTFKDMIRSLFSLLIKCIRLLFVILIYALRYVIKFNFMHEFAVIKIFLQFACFFNYEIFIN
jgi:hypothetical protein